MPTIEIHPIADWSETDSIIRRLSHFDWLIFTSVNGVDAFLQRIWELGFDSRLLAETRIACIGPATSARLETYALRADLIPNVYRGEELAAELIEHVEGKKVLWARANRGRDVIPDVLANAGADFTNLVVYDHRDAQQLPDEAVQALETNGVDWIALSSPSIARNIATRVNELGISKLPKFAAISPVTEQAALDCGLSVDAVAEEHTWEGLFGSICEFEINSR